MDRNKITWLILIIWCMIAIIVAFKKSSFPAPYDDKAILRDELIRMSEP